MNGVRPAGEAVLRKTDRPPCARELDLAQARGNLDLGHLCRQADEAVQEGQNRRA